MFFKHIDTMQDEDIENVFGKNNIYTQTIK